MTIKYVLVHLIYSFVTLSSYFNLESNQNFDQIKKKIQFNPNKMLHEIWACFQYH